MLTHPNGLLQEVYFGWNGCCCLKFLHTLQRTKLYFQSDLRCRVAWNWALPHISSLL